MKRDIGLILFAGLLFSTWYAVGFVQGHEQASRNTADLLLAEYERGRDFAMNRMDPEHQRVPSPPVADETD